MPDTQAPPDDVKLALNTLESCWMRGRQILVVLGAGASVAARIPPMTDVYAYLAKQVKQVAQVSDNGRLIGEMSSWLESLSRGNAPRSLAAMALGTLQRAHERVSDDSICGVLRDVWDKFSRDFVNGRILSAAGNPDQANTDDGDDTMAESPPPGEGTHSSHTRRDGFRVTTGPLVDRTPTALHLTVAEWAVRGRAALISVNFDGLTRRALDERLGDEGRGVVLSEPDSLARFYLGGQGGPGKRIVPVVKVWGDVFHAVCRNVRCPEAGARVPIFELQRRHGQVVGAQDELPECPSCGCERQLQIFFPGYEEKERTTRDLMRELLALMAPQVGCVVTVGLSGLWDQALVDFISSVCTDLDDEVSPGSQQSRASCVCVDPAADPFLLLEMARRGLHPVHLQMTAEDFAERAACWRTEFESRGATIARDRYDAEIATIEHRWEALLKDRQEPIPLPACYRDVTDPSYLRQFRHLRQLGIKTKRGLWPVSEQTDRDTQQADEDHNRLRHSRGTAHLALTWFEALSRQASNLGTVSDDLVERLRTVVLYAAIHHDLGHMPFTHLAEEIFEEVHWSMRDWGKPFRHDEPVLANVPEVFQNDVACTTKQISASIGVAPDEFTGWVECAIQGRSGFPWVDAILSSPLDADKVDYVFRDCDYVGQGLHIARQNQVKWVRELFGAMRVLPSGLVALEGVSGERAHEFLEERSWLYKHQYFQPGFRALERIARAIIVQWLLLNVPSSIAEGEWYRDASQGLATVGDPSTVKGRQARSLLWTKLLADGGKEEPRLLLTLVRELDGDRSRGLPSSTRLVGWARRCRDVMEAAFDGVPSADSGGARPDSPTLLQHLRGNVGVTCSECFYAPFTSLPTVREIVRRLETERPYGALFDIAVPPRMLSYPSRRRLRWQGDTVLGECYAVADDDPDRWSMRTNRWVPMSRSAYAQLDRNRWAKLMVVSPFPNDPEVSHAEDRFRNLCREGGVGISDGDPDETRSPV